MSRSLKNANLGQPLDFSYVCYMVDFNRPVERGKCLEISWMRSQHNERRRGIDLVSFTKRRSDVAAVPMPISGVYSSLKKT